MTSNYAAWNARVKFFLRLHLPSPVTLILARASIFPKWLWASQTYTASSSTHKSDRKTYILRNNPKAFICVTHAHMWINNLTGDVQTTLGLRNSAMCARSVEKEESILSPPGDPWFRVTLSEAHQGHIEANVHSNIWWFPGELGRSWRVQGWRWQRSKLGGGSHLAALHSTDNQAVHPGNLGCTLLIIFEDVLKSNELNLNYSLTIPNMLKIQQTTVPVM